MSNVILLRIQEIATIRRAHLKAESPRACCTNHKTDIRVGTIMSHVTTGGLSISPAKYLYYAMILENECYYISKLNCR